MRISENEANAWGQALRPWAACVYGEPGRHYHNQEHIRECMDHHAGWRSRFENPWAAYFALLFHDCVYDPRRSDNEERSADTAAGMLNELGAPQEFIDEVARLILATKHEREPAADDIDARLVIDIDLAVLAAPQERFDRYESDVRKEYAHVSDNAFRTGRAAVLRRFLARPSIYLTEFFRDKYEAAARANLERSLARLEISA